MYPFKRREKILEKLRHIGQITISEESKLLGISASTLHRDLEELEKEGMVKKVRGGAIPSEGFATPTHFDIRMKNQSKEKEYIAKNAVETIEDDSSIFLDHSTTVFFLANELKRRTFRNLIILTNSLAIHLELAKKKGIQVMLTGGVVKSEFKALSGRLTSESIHSINLHQIFVSVGAVSLKQGLMTQIPFIQELLPEVFLCGRQINILVDSSKFFKIATFRISPLDASINIFSDKGLPRDLIEEIEKKGARVFI